MNLTNNLDAMSNLNVPMTNFGLHQSSFHDTYTERSLNVSRPQLNDTRLDPEVYLMDQTSINQKSDNDHSFLIRAWADQTPIDDDKTINN